MDEKQTMYVALIVQMAGKTTTPHEMIVMNATDDGTSVVVNQGDEFTLSMEPIQENAWQDIVVVGTDETGMEIMTPIDVYASHFLLSSR